MSFESTRDIWLRFDEYTTYSYRKILERLHADDEYSKLIMSYAEKKLIDSPKPLLEKNFANAALRRQNVQFIENAKETFEAGLEASNKIKPILYHYSWNSFLAFLIYSFMRFNGVARGHGITVTKMESNEIKLEFHPLKEGVSFKDLWISQPFWVILQLLHNGLLSRETEAK